MTGRIALRAVGEAAWLLEGTGEALGRAYRRLQRFAPGGMRDLVPAAASLLVIGEEPGAISGAALRALLDSPASPASGEVDPLAARTVEIPVRYDGEDLPEVAGCAGLSVEAFVAAHREAAYRVAFVGFQPGFPYLTGLPVRLATPRRATPRPRDPAGSVAIGAAWCGVYPAATPGGWNLIGTTSLQLFDPGRPAPSLLSPGDEVRFVPE